MYQKRNFIFLLLTLVLSCGQPSEKTDEKGYPFQLLTAEQTGIQFTNSIENTKEFNIFRYRNFYNGGGVGIGDINNDGLPDVYFTANMGDNKLYLNKGNFQFEDITEKAGVASSGKWSTGVTMVDINADGLLDIYVCNAGFRDGVDQRNNFFINNGDLTFTDKAAEYGLDENGYTTHTAFMDYDLDGDLDVYILNNSFMPVNTLNYSNKRELPAEDWPVKDFLKGGGDKLYRNDDGKFVDVTQESGLYSSLIGFGLGITVGDVNGDQWPDFYVSNDFFERDYLYINQKDGTFKEEIKDWIQHLSMFSMGADMADINNDGLPEIFVTDMLPDDDQRLKNTTTFDSYNLHELKLQRDFYYQFMQNTLQLNSKDNFKEIGFFSGVSSSDWSWGALMFDVDNDGYRDIYVCNGIYQDVTNQDFIDFFANEVIQKMVVSGKKEEVNEVIKKMPSTPLKNKLFMNQGNLRFEDTGTTAKANQPSFSNGAAYADLDNDGDLDLIVNNLNQAAFVLQNTQALTDSSAYIKFRLQQEGLNRNAIGAKISVYAGGEVLSTELIPSRGFQSSIEYVQTIGLGARSVDSVRILWPDQQQSLLTGLAKNTLHTIKKEEQSSTPSTPAGPTTTQALLRTVAASFDKHQEDDFIEFYAEGMTFKKRSTEGPCLAVGDLNGDGLEDVFIGGAAGQVGKIYLQTPQGLEGQASSGLEAEADFEDTAAALADLDGDGDLDLIVGSGGNHSQLGARVMHDRVYINDGQGQFSHKTTAFSRNGLNTSCILPLDYDADGDLDLFVFSNAVPGVYGINSKNYLYQNDGQANFKDVIQQQAPALEKNGLVTDAIYVPLEQGAAPSLVVVGEWMGVGVYQFQDGLLQQQTESLEGYQGWWESVEAADMDQDGDLDLVLGNAGLNFYLAKETHLPIKLWLADFDKNGNVEKILTRRIDNKDVPVLLKRELTDQLVSLKKQNLKHKDYAQKGIRELLDKEQLSRAVVKEAAYFSSAVAWNEGEGAFEMEALPSEAQLSCANDLLLHDFNDDQVPDILIGNNNFGFTPQFSRIDAGRSQLIWNRPNRNFEVAKSQESGLDIRSQVQQVEKINIEGQVCFVFGINNDQPQLLCLTQ
ncbi:MAG: FG-GAP-like repeat-containing protein [Bacteroidota bacterium]